MDQTHPRKDSLTQRVFPYLVVLTGIVVCFGPCAMALNCAGIFVTPVSADLGVERSSFALYLTIMLIVTSLSLPALGKLTETMDLRLMLTGAVLAVGIPLICMSFAGELWQFYIAGSVMGVGLAQLLILAVPTLINRWFRRNVGFYVGLCMAFTGIGGVVFNLVGGHFIESGAEGWRMGYMAFGVLTLAMSLPFTLLCVRSRPNDLGLRPVGAEADRSDKNPIETDGIPAAKATKTAAFFLLIAFAFLCNFGLSIYQHLPSYVSSLTEFPAVASLSAAIASAAMAGQATGKIAIGIVNDKLGIRKGMFLATVSGIAGLTALVLVPGQAFAVLGGGFVFGLFYASGTVLIPLMTRNMFGTLDYSAIYSRVSMVGSMSAAVSITAWGVIIEHIGFQCAIAMDIAAIAVVILLGVAALFWAAKLREDR